MLKKFFKTPKIIIQNHTKQKKHSIYYVIYLYIFQFHEKNPHLFFFLLEILSWPESDSESELELELLEELLLEESELESEA